MGGKTPVQFRAPSHNILGGQCYSAEGNFGSDQPR